MFTYEIFIAELRQLIAEARHFIVQSDEDVTFQRWKRRLEEVMRRVRAEGYSPDCNIFGRVFKNTSPWSNMSSKEVFAYELQETVLELEALIDGFDRYGPPYPRRAAPKKIDEAGARQSSSHTLNVYGGIHGGQLQMGDHNAQTIVDALRELKNKIDSADASPEEKQEAGGLLQGLISHPLVTSVLGGLAGGILN